MPQTKDENRSCLKDHWYRLVSYRVTHSASLCLKANTPVDVTGTFQVKQVISLMGYLITHSRYYPL